MQKRRNVLSSPRLSELKKRRRRIILNKFLFFLVTFAIIFGISSYVSNLKRLNLIDVQIAGNKVIDADIIKTEVQNILIGKYFWLFPKTNILYYSKENIKNALLVKFKRIKNIDLTVGTNRILIVTLTERDAKYTWCGKYIPALNSNSNQKCYFMDDSGYIFDEAPYFSGNVYFKFYGNGNFNTDLPLGGNFLPDKFLNILSFKDNLKNMELAPVAFWLDNLNNANFALIKEPTLGPSIIFKLDTDFEKITENLQAAISTEPLKSKLKNNFSSLIYIDLRFSNKVYDKFQ